MSNQKPILEDIDGIVLKHDKNAKFNPLPEKEWILAKVAEIKKQLPTKEGWQPQLNFEFHIQEEGHVGRRMWANTSFLLGPDTKLFEYYTAIMGLKDLEDGQEIKLQDMKNKLCYIMVGVAKKNKDKQVIVGIKHCDKNPKDKDIVSSQETLVTSHEKSSELQSSSQDISQVDLDSIDLSKL